MINQANELISVSPPVLGEVVQQLLDVGVNEIGIKTVMGVNELY